MNSLCDHIGIITNKPKRLIGFYTGKLGFKKEKEEIISKSNIKCIFGISSDCKMTRLVSGDIKIEIFFPLGMRLRTKTKDVAGYNHWGFGVVDRKRYCQSLNKKGVKIIEINRDGHSVFFIKDPDDNRIEIRDYVRR